MDTTKDTIDLTEKINLSIPLQDESLNPNNVGFSELDISEISLNETPNECRSISSLVQKKQISSTNNVTYSTSLNKDAAEITNNMSLASAHAEDENDAENNNPTIEVGQLQEKPKELIVSVVDISVTQSEEELDEETTEITKSVVDDVSITLLEGEVVGESERTLFEHSFVEMGRRLWESNDKAQHYTKGCLWSPDGTCVLVPVHLDGMHVVELPVDLYTTESVSFDRKVSGLNSAVHIKEGGTVYDCAWYPQMNSNMPETCCWLASRQHEPIHMWDAFNGELRCTYRGYDDVDEIQAAISVMFSNDGEKIYAGYKKSIKVFDTSLPGRDSNSIPVKQTVSCFALNDSNDDTITTGSWVGYINHYDLRVPKLGPLFTLGGHSGGVTWMRYAPSDKNNWLLYSGARKDNKILQWDMRNYSEPVHTFTRNVDTNQRVYFDLSPQCEWLVSGDTTGLLRIWDLYNANECIEVQLHEDCCNGVNFHPTLPILATSSGQYHFFNAAEDDEDAKSMDKTVKATETSQKETIVDYENSLLFLWFGKSHVASTTADVVEK